MKMAYFHNNDMVEDRNDMVGSRARGLSVGLVLDVIALRAPPKAYAILSQ